MEKKIKKEELKEVKIIEAAIGELEETEYAAWDLACRVTEPLPPIDN